VSFRSSLLTLQTMTSVPSASRPASPKDSRIRVAPCCFVLCGGPCRLREFGPNVIVSLFVQVMRYFWAPVPWMLEATIALQIAIGERLEALMIAMLLILNVGLSVFQENRVNAAVALLKQRLALTARVKRDGAWLEVPAANLVPGDIVQASLGRSFGPTSGTCSRLYRIDQHRNGSWHQIRSHSPLSSSRRSSSIPLKSKRETTPTTWPSSTMGKWRHRQSSISRSASIAILLERNVFGLGVMTSPNFVWPALFPSANTR